MVTARELRALGEQVRQVPAPGRGVLSCPMALRPGCVENGLNSTSLEAERRQSQALQGKVHRGFKDREHRIRANLIDWTRSKFRAQPL